MRYTLLTTLLLLAVAGVASADCIQDGQGNVICGTGQCALDQYGKVFCAQPGGGAMRNKYGNVVCGLGYCARDRELQVFCSKVAGGGAAVDTYGEVKCLGGCEAATAKRCEAAR